MHVMSYLWCAANALFGEASQAGKHWVQQKLTAMLRGRVGYVIGGLRQILTKQPLRKSVRETLAKVITFFHNHRRWMQYDAYLAAGLPVGTGVVESACGSVVKHRMEGEGSAGASQGQRPFSRCARSRRATIMISGTTGSSMPARCTGAFTIASQNIDPCCD